MKLRLPGWLQRRGRIGRARPEDPGRCPACGSDAVAPACWNPDDDLQWRIELLCGGCGVWREVTVAHGRAVDYRQRLDGQLADMDRELRRLDHERMTAEVDVFIAALRDDVIDAADFT